MKRVALHLPLLAIVVAGMVVGIAAGLARLGVEMPAPAVQRIGLHGPILAAGVFGTLIALERAVAMRTVMARDWTWADLAPILAGAGTILLVLDGPSTPALLLLTGGAAVLVAINLEMLRRHPTLDVLTMAIGAGFLLLADAAWLADRAIPFLAPWWMAFLVLTITGERLELARLRIHGRAAYITFVVATSAYVGALLLMSLDPALGVRLSGVGMIALTAWLLRYDIAWLTIRRSGLPRFVAACLLAGYAWLGVAGMIAAANAQIWAGFGYDAYLHAVLLGFVFSMVFGHAPIIFPAVLGRPIRFLVISWVPLALLHASVAARIVGDIVGSAELRQAAGMATALAIGMYAVVIAIGLLRGKAQPPARSIQ